MNQPKKEKEKKKEKKHEHGKQTILGGGSSQSSGYTVSEESGSSGRRIVDTRGSYTELDKYNEKYDNMRIAIGNCYRTFEDASFAIEKQKVLVELQEYSTYHDKLDNGLYTIINMKNSDDSDILVVDVSKIIGDIPLVVYARKYTNDPVFFRSEKAALAAVKKVTKRRLIKYYFTGIDQDV
jgi:hypothetical protein